MKFLLLLINTMVFFLVKVVMIEQSQSLIIRDLAVINTVYLSYVLCYSFAGFYKLGFTLYLITLINKIVCVHFVD